VYASTGRADDAVPLYREAVNLHRRDGRFADAIPAAERLVELTRAAPDGDALVLALALNDLAELHRGAGTPEAGVPLLLEALDLIRTLPDDPTVGALKNNLGLAYAARGDHRQARPAFEAALAAFRVLDEPSTGLAFALNNLSQTLDALGEHEAADEALAESLDVRRELFGADSGEYASALLNRGIRLLQRGDLEAARPALEESLATLRRTRGDHHPDVAAALNALGHLHRRLGRYADAEALLRFALGLQQASLGPDDVRLGFTLDNLAGVLHVRGDVNGADRMFRQAIEILTRQLGPDHPEVATVLNNYGQLLVEVGRDAEAERVLTRAMTIREAGSDDLATATVANNLGILRSKTGRDDAVALLERGLELRRRVLGDDNLDVAQSLNNVGSAIGAVDPTRARELLETALEVRTRLLGPDHPDVAETLNNLSFVCGDRDLAAALLEDAVRIRRATSDGPVLAETLNNLAFAYALLEQLDRTLALFREAADVRDRLIARVAGLAAERERLGYLAPVRAELALFLTVVRARMADRPEAVRLACDLVLRRKAVVTEGIADQRAAVLGGRYPSLRDELRELDALREQIARCTLGGASPGPEAVAELAEFERRRQELEVQLAGQIPELDATRRLRAADTGAVSAALPAGAALIELVRVTTHDPCARMSRSDAGAWYAAFVIPAGDPDGVRFVDLGAADALEELVVDFRASITGRREAGVDRDVGGGAQTPDEARGDAAGQALAQRLLEPLTVSIADRRRLFVAPDGELTRLPLEVLPLGDGRRVIDEFIVSYLGAGRDVLRLAQQRTPPRSEPVVVADPDYDLQAPSSSGPPPPRGGTMFFTRLAGTRREGSSVATMLGVPPFLGADAVEATIKSCAGPSVLHIATHGFFQPDPADPRELPDDTLVHAGLALAGANTASAGRQLPAEAEDGILTAEDLAGLDLLGTRLVVLSACETGLGRVSVGEGVFGLRRSVTLAGAETLVMSLWKVPDIESCALMEHFYRRVIAGEERAAALRAAQLAIKEQRPHPFYWGAFVCEGNPGSLTDLGADSRKSET
jgi:CHAT domain-containing protein/tetratricopeptide (TPR) repeat protein